MVPHCTYSVLLTATTFRNQTEQRRLLILCLWKQSRVYSIAKSVTECSQGRETLQARESRLQPDPKPVGKPVWHPKTFICTKRTEKQLYLRMISSKSQSSSIVQDVDDVVVIVEARSNQAISANISSLMAISQTPKP